MFSIVFHARLFVICSILKLVSAIILLEIFETIVDIWYCWFRFYDTVAQRMLVVDVADCVYNFSYFLAISSHWYLMVQKLSSVKTDIAWLQSFLVCILIWESVKDDAYVFARHWRAHHGLEIFAIDGLTEPAIVSTFVVIQIFNTFFLFTMTVSLMEIKLYSVDSVPLCKKVKTLSHQTFCFLLRCLVCI